MGRDGFGMVRAAVNRLAAVYICVKAISTAMNRSIFE